MLLTLRQSYDFRKPSFPRSASPVGVGYGFARLVGSRLTHPTSVSLDRYNTPPKRWAILPPGLTCTPFITEAVFASGATMLASRYAAMSCIKGINCRSVGYNWLKPNGTLRRIDVSAGRPLRPAEIAGGSASNRARNCGP